MDAGNWSLDFGGKTFIDDSGKKFSDTVGKAGRVFNIVVGDLNLGQSIEASISEYEAPNGEGYGLFYPDQGLMVFNPSAMASGTTAAHASAHRTLAPASGTAGAT